MSFNNRRRVDWRVLPLLGLLYSISMVDRINLGVAREAGMGEALVCLQRAPLRLVLICTFQSLSVGTRYNTVSCLYFVPYILLWV
jgi:hypothetical protein